MKATCTGFVDGFYQFKFDGDTPEYGHKYELESMHDGTSAQNKLFHSLVMVYYNSGQHNDDKIDFYTFRERIKKNLGCGFESYIYVEIVNDMPKIKHARKIDDIPDYIRSDPLYKDKILGKLKSWSSYSKNQRTTTIQNLINEMLQVGVQNKKFDEILTSIDFH